MIEPPLTTPKLVVFADLDDTLFQTLHKRNTPGSVAAGLGRDGLPLSYACPKQQKLLACLTAHGTVIPTTARNFASFQRVQLPFTSYAILNFGATLLNPGGQLNEEWHQRMSFQAQKWQTALAARLESALEFNNRHALGLSIRLVSDFGQAWYILAKHLGHAEQKLDLLQNEWAETAEAGLVIRRNGNNLTLSPDFFDKKHAVEEVATRFFDKQGDVFLGFGDSLSDFAFMSSCDFLMMPSASQLHLSFAGGPV